MKQLMVQLITMLLVCLMLTPQAWAGAPLANQTEALLELRATLAARLAADPDNADVAYQLGVVAFKLNEYPAALEMFERVLALNPTHAGAMLDMALTYYAKGDYQEAEALFSRISALPNLPPKVEDVLTIYQAQLVQKQQIWRRTASIGTAIGHSSNANQGLSNDSVNLPVLGNQLLVASAVAKSDDFAELSFDGKLERSLDDQRLYLLGGLRERDWASQHEFNQRWLLAGAGLVTPLNQRLSLDSSVLAIDGRLGGHALERAGYWLNQLTLDNGAYAHWLRIEAGVQRFPDDSSYNSRQGRLVFGSGFANTDWKVLGEFALTGDWDSNHRPGGKRTGNELLLEGHKRLLPGWWLGAQWRYLRERQQNPFDPALFDQFVRVDHGNTLNLSLSWDPSPRYSWELSALHSNLDSNLELYNLRRDEIRLEWRLRWN